MLNITVMLGGPSAEREVSLRSGAAVVRALRSFGHSVSELDPKTSDWSLASGTDVVFLALHGTYGEDGTVQRRLDDLGVPYTGCGAEASRVAFDKELSKQRFVTAGVPTAPFLVITDPAAQWPAGWNPRSLKPVQQGSSVGLRFLNSTAEWTGALADAMRYDSRVLVEQRIDGRETTVAILGGQVLPIVEVRPASGVYDYTSKYTKGATDYHCPAAFDNPTTARIQQAAHAAFQSIGGGDYARVDVMVRPAGEPVVLEVNTLPGMTETSLFPKPLLPPVWTTQLCANAWWISPSAAPGAAPAMAPG
jgi:D-alanine-D-alanine ligase